MPQPPAGIPEHLGEGQPEVPPSPPQGSPCGQRGEGRHCFKKWLIKRTLATQRQSPGKQCNCRLGQPQPPVSPWRRAGKLQASPKRGGQGSRVCKQVKRDGQGSSAVSPRPSIPSACRLSPARARERGGRGGHDAVPAPRHLPGPGWEPQVQDSIAGKGFSLLFASWR